MRKTKARKLTDYTDKLHLFEATSRYVADEAVRSNKSRAVVIRELAEEARIARVSGKQMSIGLLKPVRAAQKEIIEETLNENIAGPLDSLLTELQYIRQQLDQANERLAVAATEDERQRKNLRRIFYIVSLLWNLLYNLAAFHWLAAQQQSGAGGTANAATAQSQIEQWVISDRKSMAQIILERELNKRITEHQLRQS